MACDGTLTVLDGFALSNVGAVELLRRVGIDVFRLC
jgi:hypothetical protein